MEARQTPTTALNVPDTSRTFGEDACALGAAFYGEPLPWQRYTLDVMMATDARGKWACRTFDQSVPRQNGKSWAVRTRCLWGLVVPGERILFTCHHGDTADTMFKELADVFEDEGNAALHPLLRAVRRANGQQSISLVNGGFIRFTTRTGSLGRGKTYDVLVCDEAQQMGADEQDALKPTVSAGPQGNAQTIYLGTPPGPDCAGTVFARNRARVMAGESAATWLEWGVAEVGDVSDRSRWYEANPSLGTLLDLGAVEGELEDMTEDGFARERLGWWRPAGAAAAPALDAALWDGAAIDAIGDAYPGRMAFGLKFSPDGSSYALAGCKLRGARSREAAVELVEVGSTERGTKALAEALYERRRRASCVVVDGMGGASALCDNLAALGSPRGYVVRPRASDVVDAAQLVEDALRDGTLRHAVQPALEDSAKGATRRPIGSRGGWGFGPTDAHDSTAIEAVSLALWGARNTRRDPRRKQRML